MMLTASIVGGLVVCIYVIRKYREFQWGYCKSTQRMNGKVVVITGGNSGIGKETARDLAKRGAVVILACRNREAAQVAVRDIRTTTGNGDLIFMELDLGDLSSVRKCASNLLEKFSSIHVLINNAGVSIPRDMEMATSDNFEIHFGVNHLGHFLFTNLLMERITDTPESRIVIVSSLLYKYGQINFETLGSPEKSRVDLMARKGRNPLYSDSKLCNILHAKELSRRLTGKRTSVFVLCPGFAYTGLMRHSLAKYSCWKKLCLLPVALFFMRSAKQAAQTSIHCAVSEELNGLDFGFFRDCKMAEISSNPLAVDDTLAASLWTFSQDLISNSMRGVK